MKPQPDYNRSEERQLPAERKETNHQGHQLIIAGKRVVTVLVSTMLGLLFCHLLTFWLFYNDSESSFIRHLDLYFNFNHENNFPSLFSAFLLFFSALLLALIHKLTGRADKYKNRWLLLSAVFLFLALDEALKIHERLEQVTHHFFPDNMNGFLAWTWVVPYTFLALAVAIYTFGFVMQLPQNIRNKFIFSGLLFVFAAAGTESIEGHLMKITAEDPVVLLVTTTIQELLEMASILVFISALLAYLTVKFKNIKLRMV